ncbi:hypothetical protein ACHAW6_010572 [Cyclotella cf. meneghiniana]
MEITSKTRLVRGLETKTRNPFMTTSNQSYGLALHSSDAVRPSASVKLSQEVLTSNARPSTDLSFLMSRESDRYGEGSSYSDSALSAVFRQKESDSMNKRRKHSIFAKPFYSDAPTAELGSKAVSKEELKEFLVHYNHNPKQQNPLYTTESNELGLRKPSEASCTTSRYGLSQKFSQSFNKIMYRDEGLNASMTKSKVHDQLTPQFL